MEQIVYLNFMDCIAYCISGKIWIGLYRDFFFSLYINY
jgi:hypothetical protein